MILSLIFRFPVKTPTDAGCVASQATFISEVEAIRSEMLESEVVVEGEFASFATMVEWGFSEQLVLTALIQELEATWPSDCLTS